MSLGFYIDMERCIGCRTCQVACKDRRDIQDAGPRLRRVDSFETGTYPEVGMFHLVLSCNHCAHPMCMANCSTGALHMNDDGIVLVDDEKCNGCQACVEACPYGAPQFIESQGIVQKCDTCLALREAGMNPVCVDACPMRAIDFGDLDELREKYGDGLVDEIPCIEPAATTTPSLPIKPSEASLQEDFTPVVL